MFIPGSDKLAARLRQLFPPGDAFRAPEGSWFYKVFQAFGDELNRAFQRAQDLFFEAFPSTTVECLSDWEEELGLPATCYPAPTTFDARRAAVQSKYAEVGGQSPGYYIEVAGKLGWVITIEEPLPFYVGLHGCGDPVGEIYWAFVWIAHCPPGSGAQLDCVFGRIKPSHTIEKSQES